ncbi:MAG: methylated-DNA-[protein]-cysteine S-methyltransferase [Bacteroidetes bacterium]|jgi:methylated-DNA-[protein]-cysteine S-methyltransferase|nr:methylated-DNA-[protein]-cysteine S-methyltransferase [Bacteroidota bacterium]
MFNYSYYNSPVGDLEIRYDEHFIYAFLFRNEGYSKKEEGPQTKLIMEAHHQLQAYFDGTLKQFNLPLQFEGTDFQKKVWTELTKIDFGKTISYLQMARQLGDEKSIRAAASANGKNPFAIVVPCHRVIGTDGSLTGYAGELWRKQWLLDHEAKTSGTYLKLF